MTRMHVRATVLSLLACEAAFAQPVFLDVKQQLGPEPESATRSFPLLVREPQTRLYLDIKITLTQGQVTLRLLDPHGAVVRQETTGGDLTLQSPVPTQESGTFQLEAVSDAAVGQWHVQLSPLLTASAVRLTLMSGLGMALVALAAVLYWRRRTRARWRWFWAGAGVWTVGVALKFAWAIPLNKPILHALEQILPSESSGYLAVASVYIGLLTGVFEIAVTLIAALIWRKLAVDASRAVAVGVGAGAFEALLLSLVVLVQAVALAFGAAPDVLVAQTSQVALLTPVAWLAGPVERVIAILCHTSSRALTLLTVATGRWRYFWWGFALMTVLDGIAAAFLLSGKVTAISTWWIELAIAPAVVISVPLIRWCVNRWPAAAAPPAAATS